MNVKVLVALITCSLPKYKKQTQFCLDTWGKSLPEGFDLKVCTGEALSVSDDYKSLRHKTRAAANYAFERGYDWVLKIDDDTDLRPSQLKPPVGADYAGWVSENPHQECSWAHCQGGCYWLSCKAIEIVAKARIPFRRLLWRRRSLTGEDVWVGRILLDHGVRPVHLEDFTISPDWSWYDNHIKTWRPSATYNSQWTALLQAGDNGRFEARMSPPRNVLTELER